MSVRWNYLLILLFVLILPVSASAEGNVQVVEKEGEANLGDDTTPQQAKLIALNNARRAAIEQVSGATIHGSSVVYNAELVSDLVVSATRGVIVGEEILKGELLKRGSAIVYAVKIRAHVKALPGRETSKLRMSNEAVVRYGSSLAVNGLVLQDGDEIQVKTRVNDNVWLHLFSIDQNGKVSQLYPNEYTEGQLLPADREFVFPSEEQRAMGLNLRVRLPRGASRMAESILFVATIDKKNISCCAKGDTTITDLMKELSDLNPAFWIEKAVGYEVRR